jgi:hypothetical protein
MMVDLAPLSTLDLPYDYEPFEHIDLCGNHLQNVRFLVRLKEQHPLLIGKGIVPYIWLYAPGSADLSRWTLVVERNTSLSPPFRVAVDRLPQTRVRLFGFDRPMLEIAGLAPDRIAIYQIDLTPIGINLIGDREGLQVGADTLAGTSMAGVETFIGLR